MRRVWLPEEIREARHVVSIERLDQMIREYLDRCYPEYEAVAVEDREIICKIVDELF